PVLARLRILSPPAPPKSLPRTGPICSSPLSPARLQGPTSRPLGAIGPGSGRRHSASASDGPARPALFHFGLTVTRAWPSRALDRHARLAVTRAWAKSGGSCYPVRDGEGQAMTKDDTTSAAPGGDED